MLPLKINYLEDVEKQVASIKKINYSASTKSHKKSGFLPYVLILPLMLFIAVLSLYPTALTFIKSFYRVDPVNPPVKFIGLSNYIQAFQNSSITLSWVNTFVYVIFGVGISTILAVIIALGLKKKFRGRAVILAILILPWAIPGVTQGIIWGWIYDPNFGVLNSVLQSMHLINSYQIWTSGNRIETIFFIEIVQIWQMTPLSTILILASLQSIPDEIYEAARVDGASWLKTILTITLPIIRPGIAIAVIESLIMSLNIFDQVFVLNGNAQSGSSIMVQTYNITFQNLNFGEGYALSFMAVILTMVISIGVMKLIYRRVDF